MNASSIAGIVLAGGGSRRMGGGHKFLLDLGGIALVDRVVARLRPQVSRTAISANCDPALLTATGLPVLADAAPSAGPLSGVLAGLKWAAGAVEGCTHLVSAPADTPFIPLDLAARLSAGVRGPDSVAVASSDGRRHPVVALWPLSATAPLQRFLDETTDPSMMDFVTRLEWTAVDFALEDGFDPFFNINTPGDLETARRHAGRT